MQFSPSLSSNMKILFYVLATLQRNQFPLYFLPGIKKHLDLVIIVRFFLFLLFSERANVQCLPHDQHVYIRTYSVELKE